MAEASNVHPAAQTNASLASNLTLLARMIVLLNGADPLATGAHQQRGEG